jgi:hypothetical protein
MAFSLAKLGQRVFRKNFSTGSSMLNFPSATAIPTAVGEASERVQDVRFSGASGLPAFRDNVSVADEHDYVVLTC